MRSDPRALLIAAVACVLPGAANAAVFALLERSPDVVTVLDPAAVQAVGQTRIRRAWSVTVKRALASGGPAQPGYVRTLNEYDCEGRRLRWRTLQAYSRFGDVVMQQENRADYWNAETDTAIGRAALRIVCDGVVGDAAIAAPSVSAFVLAQMQAWDSQPQPPLPADPPPAKPRKARP